MMDDDDDDFVGQHTYEHCIFIRPPYGSYGECSETRQASSHMFLRNH